MKTLFYKTTNVMARKLYHRSRLAKKIYYRTELKLLPHDPTTYPPKWSCLTAAYRLVFRLGMTALPYAPRVSNWLIHRIPFHIRFQEA